MPVPEAIDLHDRPIGFKVWEFTQQRRTSMARAHSHPDVEVNFVTRGRMRYAFGGSMVDVLPGRIAVFWGSIPHQGIEDDAETCGVWATFPLPLLLSWKLPKKFDERLLRGEFIQTSPTPDDEQRDRLLLARWPADYTREDPDSRRTLLLEIEARLRRLAAEALTPAPARTRPRAEPGIESALEFLHANYRDEIRAADVAVAAGWHEKYLMRRFRATLNISVGDYLTRLRIAHAQWLLIATEKSIIDIAFDSGYQSVAPFYQAFRRSGHGLSPLQYRKQHQRA
jgi:AraC-like DNA-binding protein